MKYITLWIMLIFAVPGFSTCPVDTPAMCAIDNQLANGRWDLSQVNGQYTLNGNEVFCEFLEDGICDLADDYNPVTGTFNVARIGGEEENHIEVACDGSITGKGHEQISGTLDKTANIQYGYSTCNGIEPQDMSWQVTIDRQYDITGQVTGPGQAELAYINDTSSINIDGVFAYGEDCYWFSYNAQIPDFDVSGTTENVILSGSYDPVSYSWSPDVTAANGTSWLDDTLHRLALNQSTADEITLEAEGFTQPVDQLYNTYFIQDTVSVTDQVSINANPETPKITDFVLTEPSQYLQDVTVNTQATVTIDWRGQPPGEVEFTYGGTIETVAGNNTVDWDFDAGDSADSIQAVAIQDNLRSEPYILATPKVSLPPWAGTSTDWNGTPGVEYQGMLNWPISLETSRNLNTLALFTGQWGLTGASSEYNATVYSDGSSGPGDLNTQVTFNFAGKNIDFAIQGQNDSQLNCEDMSTEGDATIEIPIPGWQKTLNPITAIPGLQSAACGLSGLLCDVIQSIGIKASANASVSGTGVYAGDSGQIEWTGGSVGGSIGAQAGAGIQLPKPIHQVAGVSVSGGGSGCIDFQVGPDFTLDQLGAEVELSANAFFMGLKATAEHTWPIGDACGGRENPLIESSGNGWVPFDGHLAMAQQWTDQGMQGVAVWSALPTAQSRPAGTIQYRFYDGTSQTWGNIQQLPSSAAVNHSPAIEFDDQGNLLIIYQSNLLTTPIDPSELPVFANGYELNWVVIDSSTEMPLVDGQLTQNTQHDFGPTLVHDKQQQIELFWQQSTGIELTGSLNNPASILQMRWHADSLTWGPELVVSDNLIDSYGWTAAIHAADQQMLVLTTDTDGNYTTADDRELSIFNQNSGVWSLGMVLSNDQLSDDNAVLEYGPNGAELLIWRKHQQLFSTVDHAMQTEITLAQADFMDGIGNGFSQAILAQENSLKTLIWPQSTELMLSQQGATGVWTEAQAIQSENNDAQLLFAAEMKQGQLHYGWASREASGNGFADDLTPQFSTVLLFDEIFRNGFED